MQTTFFFQSVQLLGVPDKAGPEDYKQNIWCYIIVGEGDKLKIFTFYFFFWILQYREGPNHVREDKKIEIDLW